jgi:hypothetical protein
MEEPQTDEVWPDLIDVPEPQTEIERLFERLPLKQVSEVKIEGAVESGQRINLVVSGLELEIDPHGVGYLFVEGAPIWRGEIADLKQLHFLSGAESQRIMVVGVNGQIVWMRQ